MAFDPNEGYLFTFQQDSDVYPTGGYINRYVDFSDVLDGQLFATQGDDQWWRYGLTVVSGTTPGVATNAWGRRSGAYYYNYNADLSGTVLDTVHQGGAPNMENILSMAWDSVNEDMYVLSADGADVDLFQMDGLTSNVKQRYTGLWYDPSYSIGPSYFPKVQQIAIDPITNNLLYTQGVWVTINQGLVPSQANSTTHLNTASEWPGVRYIGITVDSVGNLIVAPWNTSPSADYQGMIYKMNGISIGIAPSSSIIDTIYLSQLNDQEVNMGWYGIPDAPAYDAITGYPDVDSTMGVVDGEWTDPVSGLSTHGQYVKGVIQTAKMLNYEGAEKAQIIRNAAKSDVNK